MKKITRTAFLLRKDGQNRAEVAQYLCRMKPTVVRVGERGVDESSKVRKEIVQEVFVTDWPDSMWKEVETRKKLKLEVYVRRVLNESAESQVVIFVGTKVYADELCDKLWHAGFKCDAIHGGKKQEQRTWVTQKFREGRSRVLVATDVLQRGLDFPNLTHVVTFFQSLSQVVTPCRVETRKT